jgi:hypothetical protein
MRMRWLCGWLMLTGVAQAKVGNWCPSGTCDIAHPQIVNVFWDKNEATWNQDIAAIDKTATVQRIDTALQAIVKSVYLDELAQYSVTGAVILPPIVDTTCRALPDSIDAAISLVPGSLGNPLPLGEPVGYYADCLLAHHPEIDRSRAILNIFLPPQVKPLAGGHFCTGHGTAGHNQYGPASNVAIAVIPTATDCFDKNQPASITTIVARTTHEMVEAATDPNPHSPTGWDEIADPCEDAGNYTSPFLWAEIHGYWSNKANGCISALEDAVPQKPQIDKATACGNAGSVRFELDGTFSQPPWDLQSSGHGGDRTIFLNAKVSGTHNWSAGNFLNVPPDPVGLGKIDWKVDSHGKGSVIIHGFDNRYGSALSPGFAEIAPGDSVELSIWSTASGQLAKTKVPIPKASAIDPFQVTALSSPFVIVGAPARLSGRVIAPGNCGMAGVNVSFAASDGPSAFPASWMPVAEDGSFFTSYTPSGLAGTHTVQVTQPVAASLAVPVHPAVKSVDRPLVSVLGGDPVVITGDGFTVPASVQIVQAGHALAGSGVTVSDVHTIHFLTPAAPSSGSATITVSSAGLAGLPLDFEYFTPLVPVLRLVPQSCALGTTTATVEVDVYQPSGDVASGTVTLTAQKPILLDDNLHPVTSLTVPPQTVVRISGGGTLDAVSSLAPTQHAGLVIPASSPPQCVSGSHYYAVGAAFVGAPVQSAVLQAVLGSDGKSLTWTQPGGSASAWLRAGGIAGSALARARSQTVRAVGTVELRRMATRATLLAAGPGNRVELMEPALELASPPPHASLTVALPVGRPPASLRLLRRAPDGAWSVVPASLTDHDGNARLTATISQPGLYALGQLE